eukprot:TRINITY_DN3448_c0_g2_i1.p1 TRINITY_DN3448_c0_g2~~TRINITY_DN3448_c0_g2_i1.p1  ORF type:complete len:564 (-),score=136.39 TRINITY_DN3448_c0_g2_i1:889-2433(-)
MTSSVFPTSDKQALQNKKATSTPPSTQDLISAGIKPEKPRSMVVPTNDILSRISAATPKKQSPPALTPATQSTQVISIESDSDDFLIDFEEDAEKLKKEEEEKAAETKPDVVETKMDHGDDDDDDDEDDDVDNFSPLIGLSDCEERSGSSAQAKGADDSSSVDREWRSEAAKQIEREMRRYQTDENDDVQQTPPREIYTQEKSDEAAILRCYKERCKEAEQAFQERVRVAKEEFYNTIGRLTVEKERQLCLLRDEGQQSYIGLHTSFSPLAFDAKQDSSPPISTTLAPPSPEVLLQTPAAPSTTTTITTPSFLSRSLGFLGTTPIPPVKENSSPVTLTTPLLPCISAREAQMRKATTYLGGVTPLPKVMQMTVVDLKRELAKYGVKGGAKKWMQKKLQEIWEKTHIEEKAVTCDTSSILKGLALFGEEQDQAGAGGSSGSNPKDEILELQVGEWLKGNAETYERILTYESIKIEDLVSSIKAAGIKGASAAFLQRYLDKQGVVYQRKKQRQWRS